MAAPTAPPQVSDAMAGALSHVERGERTASFRVTRVVQVGGARALKAFCDVAVGHLVVIRGVRVVEGRQGLFVSLPRQQSQAGRWHHSVVPLTKEAQAHLSRTVLDSYWLAQAE